MNPYQYLDHLNKFGTEGGFNPGLERVEALLAEFGHPEKDLNIIHVAGTNGKGSTIAYLKSIYMEAGYRVGVYISPPLFKFNERIVINDSQIRTGELTELVKEMKVAVNKIEQEMNIGSPSFFEVVTALAFIYFYRKQVDLVLLEVGLGGRLDATNVVQVPLVSVITSIGLEHTAILGDNVEDIAREKAGIIKQGKPVITAVRKQKALAAIEEIASVRRAPLISIDDRYNYKIEESLLKKQVFEVNTNNRNRILEIRLPGKHQLRNAVLALAVVEELINKFPVRNRFLLSGFKNARWPGRLEIVRNKPLIIVDGAHNVEGMKMLINFLREHILPGKDITIVLGVLSDKDIRNMIKTLNFNRENLKLAITINKNSRSQQPEVIKTIAEQEGIVNKIYPDLKQAITATINNTPEDGVICITGSLYTVSESKALLGKI